MLVPLYLCVMLVFATSVVPATQHTRHFDMLWCVVSMYIYVHSHDEYCFFYTPADFESSADRDTVLSKKMARDRKASAGDGGNAGTASADEVL